MNRFLLATVLVVVGIAAVKGAAEKAKCSEGDAYCVKIIGNSGKIDIWKGKQGSTSSALRFEMNYIQEINTNGTVVGKQGLAQNKKHALENFANLQYTYSNVTEKTVRGAKADALKYTVQVPGPQATLAVELFFIKEDKEIELCDGSKYKLEKGTVKMNFDLSNWKFCVADNSSTCANGEVGAYVEFAAQMTAPNGKEAKRDDNTKKSGEKGKNVVLDNLVMKFPEALDVDNDCRSMGNDYPKFAQSGKMQVTTMRFPKFTTKVVYDPIVASVGDVSSGTALNASFMMLAALFAVVKMLC